MQIDPNNLTEAQKKKIEEKLKNMSPEELQKLQQQQCIFCQITNGKVPSKKLYEDNICIAILDINPAAKGHILIIPKKHYPIMPLVSDEEISHMFNIAKKLSQSILKGMKTYGTTVYIANGPAAGQRAQHFMLHLIPRKEGDNLFNVNNKLLNNEILEKTEELIGNKLNTILGIKKEVQSKLNYEDKKVKDNTLVDLDKENIVDADFEDINDDKEVSLMDKEVEESDDGKKKKVNLDDIANLFK